MLGKMRRLLNPWGMARGLIGRATFVESRGWIQNTKHSAPDQYRCATVYEVDGQVVYEETFIPEGMAITLARIIRNQPRSLRRGAYAINLDTGARCFRI